MASSTPAENLDTPKTSTDFHNEFLADVDFRVKRIHPKMNFAYLMYKGIVAQNQIYGTDYLKNVGLQVHVPRTFMTIESFRSQMQNRELNIEVEAHDLQAFRYKRAAQMFLSSAWDRSHSQNALDDAEFDGLLFGTGWLLRKYYVDKAEFDIPDGFKEDGETLEYKKQEFTRFEGEKVFQLNPYNVFPDRHARTTNSADPSAWQHCWVYSVWDYDNFLKFAKNHEYKTDGVVKGGYLKQFDIVRNTIDFIYSQPSTEVRTRQDNGQLVSNFLQPTEVDMSNSIAIFERFSEDKYQLFAGNDWTECVNDDNPNLDKKIPISPIRDYAVPNELDGIGEAEVIRWQQYEENRLHNLSYLNMLMTTVTRYGVVEEDLKDPVEARMLNPLVAIRLKKTGSRDINKSIQALNQGAKGNYPKEFLAELKSIQQSATGASDFILGGSKAITDTATEAEKLSAAASQRIKSKLVQMEDRDLVPILEGMLANASLYYDKEFPFKSEKDKFAMFLPFEREKNDDAALIAEYSTKYNFSSTGVTTLEDLFKKAGFSEVIFLTDITNGFTISIKPILGFENKKEVIQALKEAIAFLKDSNATAAATGSTLQWDIHMLEEKVLEQFSEIIGDPDQYRMSELSTPSAAQPLTPGAPTAPQTQLTPPAAPSALV